MIGAAAPVRVFGLEASSQARTEFVFTMLTKLCLFLDAVKDFAEIFH